MFLEKPVLQSYLHDWTYIPQANMSSTTLFCKFGVFFYTIYELGSHGVVKIL